ncbi:MAG TPA: 50S ribosomal protein L25 [Longimicrobiaceae bacterium]|nr:50S ribosomal protein L25 [Longimicrobiaceae bacterium]
MATLNARTRTDHGKGAARSLRRTGEIPAVVYGHGEATRMLSVNEHELEQLLNSISVENTLVELKVDDAAASRALIREVQYHPVKPIILHIDLYKVHAGEKIRLEVPVRLEGNPIGVRESAGVLQQQLHEIEVECLPKDIPEVFVVDIAGLEIGDAVHVRDLSLPDVKVLNDGDLSICAVIAPSAAALPEDEEIEAGTEDVEPELIGGGEADEVPADQG